MSRSRKLKLVKSDADAWLLTAEEQIMVYDRERAIKFCAGLKRWCEKVKPEGVKADLLFQAGYALCGETLPREEWLKRWRSSEVRAEIEKRILEGKP